MEANRRIQDILRKSVSWLSSLETNRDPRLQILYHLITAQRIICLERSGEDVDWMTDILLRVGQRMDLGKKRYGHGVIVESDTRAWGTREDSWLEMCEEELLDGMVYTISDMIRKSR